MATVARDGGYGGSIDWWSWAGRVLVIPKVGCSSSYVELLAGKCRQLSNRFKRRTDINPGQPKLESSARSSSTPFHAWAKDSGRLGALAIVATTGPFAANLGKKSSKPHLPHRPDNHSLLFFSPSSLLQTSQPPTLRIPLHNTVKMGFADLLTAPGATSKLC